MRSTEVLPSDSPHQNLPKARSIQGRGQDPDELEDGKGSGDGHLGRDAVFYCPNDHMRNALRPHDQAARHPTLWEAFGLHQAGFTAVTRTRGASSVCNDSENAMTACLVAE